MIEYPINPSLGANVKAFPKTQYEKITEIIDVVNGMQDGTEDASVNDLTVSGTLTADNDVFVGGALETTAGITVGSDLVVNGLFLLQGTPQTLTGAGAVNLTTKVTLLVTTGANALTLAAGTTGQVKIITMKTDGGDGTLTPTGLRGGTTITFNDVGDTVTLMYVDSAWIILSNFGCTVA